MDLRCRRRAVSLGVMADVLELWEAVDGAPGYEVSNWGRVRRGDDLVVTWTNRGGYEVVSLERGGRSVLRYVHELVVAAFLEPRPPGHQVNHGDGVKHHNDLENLEWSTPSANVQHAWSRGLMPRSRVRRTTCRHGHPLEQTYAQRDRHGIMRTYHRCARCRRARARRARDRARGFLELFELCAAE